MRTRNIDLIVICVLAVLTFILALGKAGGPDSANNLPIWYAPIGLLMAAFIPGYVVLDFLVPQLERIASFLLAMVISFSIDILLALLLNLTPWGLQPTSWSAALGAIILIASLGTALRRRNASEPSTTPKALSSPINWRNGLLYGAAVIVTAIGIGLVLQNESRIRIAFTQLWAIPAAQNGEYALNVGVKNLERQTTSYDLYADENGVKVQEWPQIVLAPDETWTGQIIFSARPTGTVRLSLYLLDDPNNVYRMVQIAPASFDLVITPTPTIVAP